MAQRGEAADYYQGDQQAQQSGAQYGNQGDMRYEQQQQQQYQPPPPPQQQQQQYSQQPPNYGYNGATAQQETGAGKQSFDQKFAVQKPKWNDLWATILFVLVFAGFVAASGLSLQGYDAFKDFNGNGIYGEANNFSLNTNTVVLFAFVILVALVLSWGYITLARTFPKTFIWVTGILNIIFGLVTAIYMLIRKYYSGGIVFLIFVAFTIFCFITWIPRIPFSALMLKTSVNVSKKYGHVYLVSLLGGILASAFGAWYSITLVAIYTKYEPGDANDPNPACASGSNCSSAIVIGLIVFVTFAMYWISEVIKNVMHVTVSGIYGSWYFAPHDLPRGPTRGAFKRAMTFSFGSICFGSLIVAIINALRQACSVARQQAASQGDMLQAAVFCCLQCLIGLLDWAVSFINRYAFSHIALYGKAYIPAAKDTWQMIKSRGIDALVNECLLGPVMTMGSTFVAYATALLGYLYLVYTDPGYNSDGTFTPVVIAFSFLVGLQICQIFTTPISSGIDTLFVAMAFDPQIMYNDHPELFQEMIKVYPKVQEVVQPR